jgi:hypothetical protein
MLPSSVDFSSLALTPNHTRERGSTFDLNRWWTAYSR